MNGYGTMCEFVQWPATLVFSAETSWCSTWLNSVCWTIKCKMKFENPSLNAEDFVCHYPDSISFGIHGFVTNVKVQVFHSSGQSSKGIVTHFGSFFHSYGAWDDKLGLFVTRIAQFGVSEKQAFWSVKGIQKTSKMDFRLFRIWILKAALLYFRSFLNSFLGIFSD